MFLAQKAGEHHPIAQGVDPPWNAPAPRVNQIEAGWFEARIILPSHMAQTMLDVGLRLLPVQRTQMIGRDHTLPQLLHLRTLHHFAELWLSNQETLQKGLVAELEIRQHP